MARPGRPALDSMDLMEQEGRYLLARGDLGRRLDRAPTLDEIAEYMDCSARTVDTIRSRVRTWRRWMVAELGWDDAGDDIDWTDQLAPWTVEADLVRAAYLSHKITTAEAAELLGQSDERTLRRWRARIRTG